MSKLHNLKSSSLKRRKRVGRGDGSGHGTFSTRGMNGQNSRKSGGVRPGFEGGQTPLWKKLPKLRGFKSINRIDYFILNLTDLENICENGDTVNAEYLSTKGILPKKQAIKVLGSGELSKKLTVEVDKASKSAVKAIEKAGGTVKLLVN